VPGMNVVGFFIAGTGNAGRVKKETLRCLLPGVDMFEIMQKIKFINKNIILIISQL
jgi:hypothetical protein